MAWVLTMRTLQSMEGLNPSDIPGMSRLLTERFDSERFRHTAFIAVPYDTRHVLQALQLLNSGNPSCCRCFGASLARSLGNDLQHCTRRMVP
jgi:hypothetical protein